MNQNKTIILALCLSLVLLASLTAPTEAHNLDQLMANYNGRNNVENGRPDVGSRISNMFKDMMSVNVPIFYDMVRNGSSMGINVLSGLVKVERGEEAERSGLQGRKPLSVRVFGVPVYERGFRTRDPEPLPSNIPASNGNNEPKVNDPTNTEEEELPIYP